MPTVITPAAAAGCGFDQRPRAEGGGKGLRPVLRLGHGNRHLCGLTVEILRPLQDQAGEAAAINRMVQGCAWQRCRVHFLRNLSAMCPKRARTWWPPQ